jgi:hypothetical protein
MRKFFILIFAFTLFYQPGSRADEGMWLLPLIEKLNMDEMTELGLDLSAEEIYSINNSSLKDAIVIFGGGCTGEIISSQGLLLTNHHCGYSQIQEHSSVEHDYLKDGFWAMSKEEELPNPELSVKFLVRIEDVSGRVLEDIDHTMDEDERLSMVQERIEKITSEVEEDSHYLALVKPMFTGNQYYLFVYEEYKDVRLVGAPPSSIGKFGAETDNWMWPRHTGDFALFRVYTGPDGKPADYSDENIPLKPNHHLKISLKGVEEGDFAMVLGNPGTTERYMTSWGVNEVQSITHPNRIKIRGIRQEILMAAMQSSQKIRIQYASKYARSSNYWKFSIGQSKGLDRLNIYEKKKELESEFNQWVNNDELRDEKYGNALSLIENAIKSRAPYKHSRQYLMETMYYASEIYSFAAKFRRLEKVLDENQVEDEPVQFLLSDLKEETDKHFKNYNAPTDQKVVEAMLALYEENVDKEYYPEFFRDVSDKYSGKYDKYVRKLFRKSMFDNKDEVMDFLQDPDVKSLRKDPAFVAGKSVIGQYRELRKQSGKYEQDFIEGERKFIAGLMEMKEDKEFYPDANFTMRLTYGTVGDYSPRDAVQYDFQTTLKGVMEKEDPDNWEFVVSEKLKELYETKDYGNYSENDTMYVCFTTDNDITGGNSGSPVLNDKGELIGLAFDGNWEAMSGDIVFEEDLQKCINVDIRYVLFIIDRFAGAKNLIDELDIRM